MEAEILQRTWPFRFLDLNGAGSALQSLTVSVGLSLMSGKRQRILYIPLRRLFEKKKKEVRLAGECAGACHTGCASIELTIVMHRQKVEQTLRQLPFTWTKAAQSLSLLYSNVNIDLAKCLQK